MSAAGRGGGEPPGMTGTLTCQTPNLPSLSFSSPPPSPRGTGPPLCPCPSQELNSEENLCKCSVHFHCADFGAPARLWALGAQAPPRCASGRLSLAGDPVLSRSQHLLLPFSGQGHVGGVGWSGGDLRWDPGFSVPLAIFSNVCILRFRLCPGVVLQQ